MWCTADFKHPCIPGAVAAWFTLFMVRKVGTDAHSTVSKTGQTPEHLYVGQITALAVPPSLTLTHNINRHSKAGG